jgi:hypothetical protein
VSGRLLCDQTATVFVKKDLEFRCGDHAEEELEDGPEFSAILVSLTVE